MEKKIEITLLLGIIRIRSMLANYSVIADYIGITIMIHSLVPCQPELLAVAALLLFGQLHSLGYSPYSPILFFFAKR